MPLVLAIVPHRLPVSRGSAPRELLAMRPIAVSQNGHLGPDVDDLWGGAKSRKATWRIITLYRPDADEWIKESVHQAMRERYKRPIARSECNWSHVSKTGESTEVRISWCYCGDPRGWGRAVLALILKGSGAGSPH